MTLFLGALALIVVGLAAVAVIQSRLETGPEVELIGEWRLTHIVQWGPYKGWTFDYLVRFTDTDGEVRAQGETRFVNGQPPGPDERTTLDVVRTLTDRGNIIAWFFERNGVRAGRGAIKWRVFDQNRLLGTFRTTFYRGASVAQRVEAESSKRLDSGAD